jgi:hypothetical protein
MSGRVPSGGFGRVAVRPSRDRHKETFVRPRSI